MITTSIIMPCRDCNIYIAESIQSVLNQSISDYELLIIDDHSSSECIAYVAKLASLDKRINYFHSPGYGAANARNFGIRQAKGRFIAFLDSDDLWHPEKLEKQIAKMKELGLCFSWSSYSIIDRLGHTLRIQNCFANATYDDILRKRSVIGCLTAIYDTATLGKLYMPDLKMRQDYGLWFDILKMANEQGMRSEGLVDVLGSYRVHEKSLTRNKLRAAYYQWLLYRKYENLSFLYALSCMKDYLINGSIDRLSI